MNNPSITLTVSVERTNLILQALAELPFRVSADLIADLRHQAQQQVTPAEPAAND